MTVIALVYAAGVIGWIGNDRRVSRRIFHEGSTKSTAPEGLSLAFHYLEALSKTGRSVGPVSYLAEPAEPSTLPKGGVLFRISPPDLPLSMSKTGREDDEEDGDEKENPDNRKPGKPARKTGKHRKGAPAAAPPASAVPAPQGSAAPLPAGSAAPEPETEPAKKAKKKRTKPEKPKPPAEKAQRRTLFRGLLFPAEEEWIRAGGRFVLATSSEYGALSTVNAARGESIEKADPVWPSALTIVPGDRVLAGWPLHQMSSVFVRGGRSVIARRSIGDGELIVLSCPEIFENQRIGAASHLALLQSLAGEGRPVIFDEWVHGLRTETGTVDLLAQWGLGPFLALLALTGVVIVWRRRSRLGPAETLWRDDRSEAVDFVDSLGSLYDRALSRHQKLALYNQALLRAVSRETGLRGAAAGARVSELLQGKTLPPAEKKGDLTPAVFQSHLETINEAFRRLEHVHHGTRTRIRTSTKTGV